MPTKGLATITICFHYLYFLAAAESMIWLEQSGVVMIVFTTIHLVTRLYQFNDRDAPTDKKLSKGFRVALVTADTLVTFIILFGSLWIEFFSEEHVDDLFRYTICFFGLIVAATNIHKHHVRQVDASRVIHTQFSVNFDP